MWERIVVPPKPMWRHSSGWMVRHCGHPTALWPYFVQHEELHDGCEVVSFNGRGFKSAEIGRTVVELILAGDIEVTDKNCVPRVRRVMVTTQGELVREDADGNRSFEPYTPA